MNISTLPRTAVALPAVLIGVPRKANYPIYIATIGCAASAGSRGTTPENAEPSLNHDAGAGWPHNVCRRGSVSDQRIGA